MAAVTGSDTTPEIAVRRLLHRLGYRFRLHRDDLPGTPDIVLPGRGTVLFVHGCFWHRHQGCKRTSVPETNRARWLKKFRENMERDRRNEAALRELGWRVIVVWECETKDPSRLAGRLRHEILPHGFKPGRKKADSHSEDS